MGFSEAVSSCFSKYVTFSGRARRSEYWYFVLFQVHRQSRRQRHRLCDRVRTSSGALVDLALILPALAVSVRRLHDIDKSGWWLLIGAIPLIGWLFFIIWGCTKGTLGPNRFGPDPLPTPFGAPA